MPDYSKGKIYKIVCNETGLIYVGSTTQELNARLSKHKSNYKLYLDGKETFVTSYEIIKNNNFKIELLELVNCNCNKEFLNKEKYWIENMDCVNICIPNPNRNKKEYKKQWAENNKIHLKEYKRLWYLNKKNHASSSPDELSSSSGSLTTNSSNPLNNL